MIVDFDLSEMAVQSDTSLVLCCVWLKALVLAIMNTAVSWDVMWLRITFWMDLLSTYALKMEDSMFLWSVVNF